MHRTKPLLVSCLLVIGANLVAQGAAVSTQLPESIDLRPEFERWELARRTQGARPTCSVFTVAGALEYAVAKRQGHPARLSVEFLNWAGNKASRSTQDGGFFSDLWNGFTQYGICTEADMPYESVYRTNREPSVGARADAKTRLTLGLRMHWIKPWDVNTGLTDEHVRSIQQTLSQGWPVCGGFRWPKREAWDGDLLRMCPSNAVRDGHSVLLVGYRNDSGKPGGGVFIFRNTSREGRDGAMSYVYAREYMNDALWIDYQVRPPRSTSARMAPSGDVTGLLRPPADGPNRRVSRNELPQWHDANLAMTLLPHGWIPTASMR